MKEWIGYIKKNIKGSLWGPIFLDYYLAEKNNDSSLDASEFIDEKIILLFDENIDLISFHQTFINICIQLLGNNHQLIIKKSIRFLKYFYEKISRSKYTYLKQEIFKQYELYGWSQEFNMEIRNIGGNAVNSDKQRYKKRNKSKRDLLEKDKNLKKNQIILCIATEWFSNNGGISTFNRQLCISMVEENYKVYCLVKSFNQIEYESASSEGVILIKNENSKGVPEEALLFVKPILQNNEIPDIIIGHDRITGPVMVELKKREFKSAKSVLFIHTAPEEIEWYKEHKIKGGAAKVAYEKSRVQIDLAKNSDLVVAVGPRLESEIKNQLAGLSKKFNVFRFDPGLFELSEQISPDLSPIYQCLLLGRIDDYELKGVDIAALAMSKVWERSKHKVKPHLVIRGANSGEAVTIRSTLKGICNPGLEIRVKEYNSDEEELHEDIRRSSVVLMPSRKEGFGLVGLEALSLRRPILVSQESGLSQLINELLVTNGMEDHWTLNTSGNVENVCAEWAMEIEFIFKDREAALTRLDSLAIKYAEKYSWSRSIQEMMKEINKL
jgi:glycosyltransferase involved in cell wall biosynthesis